MRQSVCANAAGYQIVHTITQNFLKKPKYGISGGDTRKTGRSY